LLPQSYRGSRPANGHRLVIIWSKNTSKALLGKKRAPINLGALFVRLLFFDMLACGSG
jgi:hypothetical protein